MAFELGIAGLVLMGICTGMAVLFLRAFYRGRFVRAVVFKGLASLCFIIFAFLICIFNGFSLTRTVILVGLILGIIGDEIIALCQVYPKKNARLFIGGGAFFLFGHVIYVIYMLITCKINLAVLLLSVVLIVTFTMLYAKRKKYLDGEMRSSLILYLTIVTAFSSVAISAFAGSRLISVGLLALGGILFAVSDNILFAYKLGDKPRFIQNALLHAAYYLAQFSIAWSMMI